MAARWSEGERTGLRTKPPRHRDVKNGGGAVELRQAGFTHVRHGP